MRKPDEICTIQANGFAGFYYAGTAQTEKATIAVGGASCSEKASVAMSKHLIEAGYNVLVLGFYYWKGLSKALRSVPVDYCERAINWLKEKKDISKIAMTGISTGAGYTLLCASLLPQITCVIPIVPFDHVLEGTTAGFKRAHCSTYCYHGKDLPYTPLELLDQGKLAWLLGARRTEGYGLSRFMRYGYDLLTPHLTEESRIKVENMNADVLLLAAKGDDCWPSDEAVPRMAQRLQECDYPHRVESYVFEKASHALSGDMNNAGFEAKVWVKTVVPTEKKYPSECEAARRECMRRSLDFINQWK